MAAPDCCSGGAVTHRLFSSRLPFLFLSLIVPEACPGRHRSCSLTLPPFQSTSQSDLGYASEDGSLSLPSGSLLALAHKVKQITDALEGAGRQPTEAEDNHEVSLMSQTNMYRPGIDVTQSELVPHLNWRRQEKTEMVGNWKAKVYDMLHVMVSVKSRRCAGCYD
ncbi:ankyrin repeat domain-containing protein 13C-B [Spatholobus suberectus]|nr:ankyrin repeat domain-containing protein 13C-B [Spatholobus suberectus]